MLNQALDVIFAWYRYQAAERLVLPLERARDFRCGAVTQIQRFSSALSLNPHLHSLIPDGAWYKDEQGRLHFVAVLPPSTDDIEDLVVEIAERGGDRKDKAPSRCQRGDPRVHSVCPLGRLTVRGPVESSGLATEKVRTDLCRLEAQLAQPLPRRELWASEVGRGRTSHAPTATWARAFPPTRSGGDLAAARSMAKRSPA